MDGYQREGAEVHPAWALRGLALVAAHDGRLDDARALGDGGRAAGRRSAATRSSSCSTTRSSGSSPSRRARGRRRTPQLTTAAAMADRMAVRHPGRFKLAGDQVEAALALGDVERAAAVVERLDEAARVAPTPWVLAVGARSAALLAAAAATSTERSIG